MKTDEAGYDNKPKRSKETAQTIPLSCVHIGQQTISGYPTQKLRTLLLICTLSVDP